MGRALVVVLLATAALGVPVSPARGETIAVGSKRFTESYILGEIVRETAARAGARATHRQGLGNTGIVFAALKAGEIDVYRARNPQVERGPLPWRAEPPPRAPRPRRSRAARLQ
jgi:osmoprotectant transport system permease protein